MFKKDVVRHWTLRTISEFALCLSENFSIEVNGNIGHFKFFMDADSIYKTKPFYIEYTNWRQSRQMHFCLHRHASDLLLGYSWLLCTIHVLVFVKQIGQCDVIQLLWYKVDMVICLLHEHNVLECKSHNCHSTDHLKQGRWPNFVNPTSIPLYSLHHILVSFINTNWIYFHFIYLIVGRLFFFKSPTIRSVWLVGHMWLDSKIWGVVIVKAAG